MTAMTQLMPMKRTSTPDEAERLIRYDGFPISAAIRIGALSEGRRGRCLDAHGVSANRLDPRRVLDPRPGSQKIGDLVLH
jgi:hypothetical protein